MGIVIACMLVGVLVIAASFVATWRTQRARERLTATDESALDRALFHLINDIARDQQAAELAPQPRDWLVPVTRPPGLAARTRMPRGTPSDSVLLSTRLSNLPDLQTRNPFDEDAPTTVAVAYLFDSPRR